MNKIFGDIVTPSRVHPDITGTIGRTPVVRLNRLAPSHVELMVKLEAFNPGGSVKDRMALAVIEAAERDGRLRPGQTVVEATSGNAGIALAMICAQRGYPFVAVMAENFSVERRRLMRMFGAKVVLTPASERGSGMLAKAEALSRAHGWFMARQFENDANAEAHARTTAQEILDDFAGTPLDVWVTGFGTGGTLNGAARVLKAARPGIRIIVGEPDNAPVLSSTLAGAVPAAEAARIPHPAFRPHPMQGWAPDFVPRFAAEAAARGQIDRIVAVSGDVALETARRLARTEGILAGITGGASLAAALTIAETAPRGSRILCMLPDTGERYLSTPLFADIPVEMTAEEAEIARSTPGQRFDGVGAVAAPTPAVIGPAAPGWATALVEDMINDPAQPVVMFALEWCEFCWAVRRMFRQFDVPFRAIDLDSAENRTDGRGAAIRAALAARTGARTIPQIFVGGDWIGGSAELVDAWGSGRVQMLLRAAGVGFDDAAAVDAAGFLPAWLHPRGA